MNSESNNSWNDAFRGLRPNAQPSAALLERVSLLAAAADAKRAESWPRRRNIGIASGILAAAVTLLTLAIVGPKIALARTLHTVSVNLLAARGCHYQVEFFHHGRKTLSTQVWYRDGAQRVESTNNGVTYTQIQAGGKLVTFQSNVFRATTQNLSGVVKNSMNALQLQAQVQQVLLNRKAEKLGIVTLGKRPLLVAAEESPVMTLPMEAGMTTGRQVLWIDLDEMLPAATEMQIKENGKWMTTMRVEYDFEHAVPTSVFRLPRRDIPIDDLKVIGAAAGQAFAKPIAVSRLGKCLVALRDVQINRDGDVCILFTDGSTWSNWKKGIYLAKITDDIGTLYVGTAGGIEPFMYHQDPHGSRGMMIGKETVQGACMVPAVPSTALAHRPRFLKLFFESDDGPTTRHAAFTVAAKFTNGLLPTYSAVLAKMSLEGGYATNYKLDRYMGRQMYFANARDWSGLLRATDDGLRDGVEDVNIYVDRATAFEGLNRWEDARKALIDAKIADTNGFGESMIADAEAKLKAARPTLAPAHAH